MTQPIHPGGGGAAVHGRNNQEGVDVDRFIGYPAGLVTHNILSAGDPYLPVSGCQSR